MKKILISSIGLLILTFLMSCASTSIYQRGEVFIESEYAPYAKSGTASIFGQAFLKTRGGDVKYAAGNEIHLNPVTSYSTEWFEVQVLQEKQISAPDLRAEPYHKTTIGDGEGRFKFENLPAGEYYIATQIVWEVPNVKYSLFDPATKQTGWNVGMKVRLADGEHKEIILTK